MALGSLAWQHISIAPDILVTQASIVLVAYVKDGQIEEDENSLQADAQQPLQLANNCLCVLQRRCQIFSVVIHLQYEEFLTRVKDEPGFLLVMRTVSGRLIFGDSTNTTFLLPR